MAGSGGPGFQFACGGAIFGVKIGVAKKFQNDWEIAGAAWVAFSLVTDANKEAVSSLNGLRLD